MNTFWDELIAALEERGYDPTDLLEYLRHEITPMITVDEEGLVDPDTGELYDYYGWGNYE